MNRPESEPILDSPRTARRDYIILTAIFCLAHGVYYLAFRLSFDTYGLYWYLHFLDVEVLRERLFESLLYLHIQPPGMNLFAGLVLKIFGSHSDEAFHVLFIFMAYLLWVTLYALQRALGVLRPVALLVTVLFGVSPAFIYYEHWMFYTLPCALLVTLSAFFLLRYMKSSKISALVGVFVSLTLLCMTRSLFHITFFVAVWASLCVLNRAHAKRIILVGLAPMLLLLFLYVKNYLIFEEFTLNTMMGRNLWVTTVGNMSWEKRHRLVDEGVLSPVSKIERWNDLRVYPTELWGELKHPDVPALSNMTKLNGAHNFNHEGQIAVSHLYLNDALYALRHHPRDFIATERLAWFSYFRARPGIDLSGSTAFRWYVNAYDYCVSLRSPIDLSTRSTLVRVTQNPLHFAPLIMLPLLFVYGFMRVIKLFRSGEESERGEAVFIAYTLIVITGIAVVGNVFEVLETYRFRFMGDALSMVLLGLLLSRVYEKHLARRAEKNAT